MIPLWSRVQLRILIQLLASIAFTFESTASVTGSLLCTLHCKPSCLLNEQYALYPTLPLSNPAVRSKA
jgi:hypothetical protein